MRMQRKVVARELLMLLIEEHRGIILEDGERRLVRGPQRGLVPFLRVDAPRVKWCYPSRSGTPASSCCSQAAFR